jgi:hypothetical protein
MSLKYERVEQDLNLARRVYSTERNAPRWFRNSQGVWIQGEDEFIRFWKSCAEIYGLFEYEEIKCLLYIEIPHPGVAEVHVSAVGQTHTNNICRFFRSLRRKKRDEGIKDVRGWILRKNRPMRAVALESGFNPTGLKMTFGQINGKPLEWLEFRG